MGKHSQVHLPGQTMNTAVHPGQQSETAKEHGVEMRGTTDTTGQVRDRANSDYDREHGDGFWAHLMSILAKGGTVDGQVQDETSQDAAILAQGVSTRSAPSIPGSNYKSYDHSQLKGMVKDGVNPTMSQEMSDAWIQLGNDMVGHQDDFVNAIGASEAEWRGTSGDKARNFMASVANYIGKAGQSAQLAGKQESLHGQALSNAGNSMPEPIPFDANKANADLKNTTNPFEYMQKYSSYMATYQASEAAHQQAADVVTTYDKSLGGASTMPAFETPPQMAGGSTPPKKRDPGDPPGGGGTHGGDTGGDTGTGSGGKLIGDTGDGSNGNGNGDDGRGTVIPKPGDGGGGHNKPGQTIPGTGHTGFGSGGGTGTPGQGYNPGNGAGGLPPGGGLNNSGFNNPGAMPIGPMGGFGGGGFDETRGGGRLGSGGAGGAGSAGRGGFGTGGGSAGAGGRGGFGVGGLAAEQAAMGRGGAGGAGGGRGAGGGGMGGMGAGRGEGGEDEEHQRASYLVEPDPDSTFGTDEMTAPPVIGG